jgi:hypothetical protein
LQSFSATGYKKLRPFEHDSETLERIKIQFLAAASTDYPFCPLNAYSRNSEKHFIIRGVDFNGKIIQVADRP